MTITHQAYRFALDPSPAQARDLARHCGAARVAFNWGLARVKAVLNQRLAEESYGIPVEEHTPAMGWSLPALRRAWNESKSVVAPWWAECSKESYNTGLDNLARALNNWAQSHKGHRCGRKLGFPRFKSKRRALASCRFTTGTIRIEPDRHHVTLPRLGRIKTHESTRKLARRIEQSTARILSATVRCEAGRWYVSFTCEVDRVDRAPSHPELAIGVDLGIAHLAVLSQPVPGVSDAEGFVTNPRHLTAALARLRRASRTVSRRQGPDRRTRRRPSKRWEKADRRRSRIYRRVTNARNDSLHKLTTGLTAMAGTVVVENLNVAGMLRNRRLARSISDSGFGEIRRQLAYKSAWRGGKVHVADRWFPSSKTCSGCGAVKPKLPLDVRVFCCEECGLVLDRDLNAAHNLAALVQHVDPQWAGDAKPARGADRKTALGWLVALKREPSPASGWIRLGPSGRKVRLPEMGGRTFAHISGNGTKK